MIGENLYNSTIDSVSMSYSSLSAKVVSHLKNQNSLGSDLLLHYMDASNTFQEEKIHIIDAFFTYNYDYNTNSCITDTYYNKHSSSSDGSNPIVNAAGLTILYTQQSSGQVSVHINESNFFSNCW